MQIYSIKGCKFRPHWNDIASLPYDTKDPSFVNWQDCAGGLISTKSMKDNVQFYND